jgi:hypothetical protein
MEVFEAFKKDLNEVFNIEPVIKIDDDVKYIETNLYPEALKILQKDETLFEVPHIIMSVNLSDLWKTGKMSKETFWKHMQMICIGSFMHGDMKEKIGPVVAAVKKYFGMAGNENSEISKILSDEKSEDHFKEVLEFIMETRIAKMFMSIVEQIDVTELNLNFNNPEEFIEMVKNPEHPSIKKVVEKVQKLIKEKVQRGEITKSKLVEEMEAVKAKITSIFGNIFNDALGGRQTDIPSAALLGNSPEARRQRMLARLQKKQREKNSQ